MLPASQLADAPDGAVDRAQPRTVALAPDHAFVVGRADLAAALDQGAVGIKQQLSIVERAAIALVYANCHHHAGLLAGLADRRRRGRWHGHGLLEQSQILPDHLEWPLHEGEIGVVRDNGFGKSCELDALTT